MIPIYSVEDFGAAIRAARGPQSGRYIAQTIGTSGQHVWLIERGRKDCRISTAIRLTEAVGYTLALILPDP